MLKRNEPAHAGCHDETSIRRAERELFLRIFTFRRTGRSGFGGWSCSAQSHQRRAQKAALKCEARADGLGDCGTGGRFFFPADGLVAFGIERFARLGAERHEADAARGVAAGILKTGDLLRQLGLAGTRGGGVQHENMVEDAHQHLQPFGLAAPEFFNLQPERSLFAVVHFLHELGKLPDLPGHLVGNFLRAGGGFFSLRLGGGPFVRRGGDLRGELFEVLNFFGDGTERACLDDLDDGAVVENERQRAEHRTERHAGGSGEGFPPANRVGRVLDETGRRRQQQRVAEQKRPFGNRPMFRVVHAASFGKIRRRRKQRRWFLLDYRRTVEIIWCVRICVIFNPAARGNKARHFRRQLDDIGSQCALKATAAPGDARRLAAEAVGEGYDLIAAAGGDGTVNEVLNGIGDAPDGFARARLGVLPLGTVNVFARELKIPARLELAWEVLRRGGGTKIDLPRVEFSADGKIERRYFIQLAGAGLDARAIELVDWRHKKTVGPLAYVVAGLKALREKKPPITAGINGQKFTGELVLAGSGKFYGGPFEIFPQADLRDGLLEVCVLPRVDFRTLLRCAPDFVARRKLPEKLVRRFRAAAFELTGESGFELDGEWIGKLPAKFSVEREKLRVVC